VPAAEAPAAGGLLDARHLRIQAAVAGRPAARLASADHRRSRKHPHLGPFRARHDRARTCDPRGRLGRLYHRGDALMFFASDNTAGAAPEIMAALARANDGHQRSYGADALMDRVREKLREVLEAPEAAVYLVATGTAANALSIALTCPPWGSVFCHRRAHVAEDECNAP